MRGFGHFIASAETMPKEPHNGESAGRAEWRKGSTKSGPNTEYFFQSADAIFPGRLHLFDVDTDRSYSITTNQADSEILLVDGNTVYYRASDRLYSATITERGLSPSHLIAKDEAIRDAHWAFIKH